MVKTIKEKVLDALAHSHGISKKDLDDAVVLQKEKGIGLDKILIEKGLVSEQDLLSLLVKEFRIPTINLSKYKIDPSLKEMIPARIARQYHLVPISKLGKTITVALSDPFNIFAVDDLKTLTNKNVDVVISEESKIAQALDNYYGVADAESVAEVRTIGDIFSKVFSLICALISTGEALNDTALDDFVSRTEAQKTYPSGRSLKIIVTAFIILSARSG